MEISTVPVYYLKTTIEMLEQQGWDRDTLLSKVGISTELLNEEKARVSKTDYIHFATLLAKELKDESLGMMKKPMKPGTFAMLCHSCIGCDTLGRLLSRISKFTDITNNSIKIRLTREDSQATFSITPLPTQLNAADQFVVIALAVVHRLASWSIGQSIALNDVSLSIDRPFYASDYNLIFGSPINFQKTHNSLNFHADYLDYAVIQDEISLREFLGKSAFQLMSELKHDSSQTSVITNMIKKSVNDKFPTFEETANKLGFSTATLRRRLRAEGTSYQSIKDSVRRDTAIYYLSQRSMSVDEVAWLAGFSEPTSFFRAFKRWTGTSPRAYASKHPK